MIRSVSLSLPAHKYVTNIINRKLCLIDNLMGGWGGLKKHKFQTSLVQKLGHMIIPENLMDWIHLQTLIYEKCVFFYWHSKLNMI